MLMVDVPPETDRSPDYQEEDGDFGDFVTIVFYCPTCGTDMGIIRKRRYSQLPTPENCRECGCSYHRELYIGAEVSDNEALILARTKWARQNGVKMADIQVEGRCFACGKDIAPHENIICVCEGTLTDRKTYRTRGLRPGKLRVNFLGKDKAIYHKECYRW